MSGKCAIFNESSLFDAQILDDRAHLVKLQKVIQEKEDIIKQLKEQVNAISCASFCIFLT